MKIHHILTFILICNAFGCSNDTNPTPPVSATTYMSLSAGSIRNYTFTNNQPPTSPANYSLTTTSRDTVIGTRTYRVFTNSNGSTEYFSVQGGDYYAYQALSPIFGNANIEILYLKDVAVNSTWMQSTTVNIPGVPFPVTLNLSSKIIERGISKTVNGISYTDVIHVKRDITASLQGLPVTGLTTDMHYYYAPRVGLIENSVIINLNFMGIVSNTNTQTTLRSATIL